MGHVYAREELPNTDRCLRFFKVSEADLIADLMGRAEYAGERIELAPGTPIDSVFTGKALENQAKEKRLYDFFRSHRYLLFVWFRELLWKIGRWKGPALDRFLDEFAPDVVFAYTTDSFYMYDLLHYIMRRTGAKTVLFHLDDLASLQQLSLSPLFWINRILLRIVLRRAVDVAAINYCITQEQQRVYSKIFGRPFALLQKAGNFDTAEVLEREKSSPLRIVYAGNIIYGRWKVLAEIAKALHSINKDRIKAILAIYSGNPVSSKVRRSWNYPESVLWMGRIQPKEVKQRLSEADILLHVESFELKQRLATKLSFSTKIVDLLEARRCIVAIGDSQTASIAYFKHNDAGVVVSDLSSLERTFKMLIDSPVLLREYGEKAWRCGVRNHQRCAVVENFKEDIHGLVSEMNR